MLIFNNYFLSKYFYYLLRHKSVALVGNSSSLLNTQLGEEIDNHDIVIRLNYIDLRSKEKYLGSKTNIRFIGCTLLNEHIPFIETIDRKVMIITTAKNKQIFRNMQRKAIFYEKRLPWKALQNIERVTNKRFETVSPKPPRTGLVCLSLLLNAKSSCRISVFGMSTKLEDSLGHLPYGDGKAGFYDAMKIQDYHCEVSTEIEILDFLSEKNIINVY